MTKIIIVEDDQMISEIYQKKFTEAGFEVTAATTGEQVLSLAKNNKFDAILLDLMMPKMSGFEVIERLRKGDEYDKDTKIIVSSNMSQREDQDKAMQLGANGFVAKSSYTPSELVAEVKRLLSQYNQQKKNEFRISEAKENRSDKKNKKILLVEDEDIFIEMFGEKLMQDGFDVISAKNGAWGVKEALRGDFDLFIIDMVMPAMTGKEIVEKIKMEDQTKNVPIIILSASVENSAAKEMEALGVNYFFTKTGITPSELSERVQELTDK